MSQFICYKRKKKQVSPQGVNNKTQKGKNEDERCAAVFQQV